MIADRAGRARAAAVGGLAMLREGRAPTRRPRVLSRVVVGLAAALLCGTAAVTANQVIDIGRTGVWVAPFVGAAAGVPLLLVLTRPTLGWAISTLGALLVATLPLRDPDPWPWTVPHGLTLLALLFALVARENLARGAVAWAVTAALFGSMLSSGLAGDWVVGVTVVAVIALLAGRLVTSNRRLAEQSAQRERERAQRMLLEERARIARDLHDIVAHHMSLVVVQAETAPYRLPGLSAGARAELEQIGQAARSALAETRTLLSLLRSAEDAPEQAPQPGAEELAALVAASRRAGVEVVVELDDGLGGLRPGASLAMYRIAQEALANAARHAPGTVVRLQARREADAVRLCVSNDRPPRQLTSPPGHGITGMRERARAEGGELTAGPTPDGRFTVTARLPAGS